MKNYILMASGRAANTASSKAKEDINQILTQAKFSPVYFDTKMSKLKKLLLTNKMINHALVDVDTGFFVVQYPLYSHFMTKALLKKLALKQVKTIGLLHDVVSLRDSDIDNENKGNEIDFFNSFDSLIVHNDKMLKWLSENGVKVPMVSLEIFDYLNPQPILKPAVSKTLIFAGNLEKADFLQKINSELSINLYGPNKADSYPDSAVYKGIYSAEELPAHLEGSFGLVWDGNSVNECNGPYGEYLKYNNPHKTSLYLSSGLPVIVWKQAAMADFVVNNNLGLAVDSLNDVNKELAKLTAEDYQQMLKNVAEVANKLRNGDFTRNAVEQAKEVITKGVK